MKRVLPLVLLAAACSAEPRNEAAAVEIPEPSGPPVAQQVERNETGPVADNAS